MIFDKKGGRENIPRAGGVDLDFRFCRYMDGSALMVYSASIRPPTPVLIAKASMAVGYGDSWTNMIQPFWTLTFFPVVAAGCTLQARDIMGYTFVAMLWSFVIFGLGVTFLPV